MAVSPRINRLIPHDQRRLPCMVCTSPLGGVFRVFERWETDGRYFLKYHLGLRWFKRDVGRVEVSKTTYDLMPLGSRFFRIGSERSPA